MKEIDQLEIIKDILSDSNIVWPKYGKDTVEKLAERILTAIKE